MLKKMFISMVIVLILSASISCRDIHKPVKGVHYKHVKIERDHLINPVPEPATMLLTGLGLFFSAIQIRKKKGKKIKNEE